MDAGFLEVGVNGRSKRKRGMLPKYEASLHLANKDYALTTRRYSFD